MSQNPSVDNSGDFLLKVSGVSLQIAGRQILDNIDLTVGKGEILTLIGPNGSGKTSLVRLLLGLLQADQGSILRRSRLRIGYMPQKLIVDNALPLTVEGFLKLIPQVKSQDFKKVSQQVEIESLLQNPVQNISGGEFQRVLLARALLHKPD